MPTILHRFALFRFLAQIRILHPTAVRLGHGVRLGRDSVLDARGGAITLERGATLGPSATLLTAHEVNEATVPELHRGPIRIGAGATLGPRCLVFPNVQIGAHALVGAESLVVGDVDAHAIVTGRPARPIGRRGADGILEFLPSPAPSTPSPR